MDGDRERNARIADRLREMAELLTAQQANPFRIQAYRRAADRVDRLDRDVGDILAEGGRDALEALPDIGDALALAIEQMVRTGRWPQLEPDAWGGRSGERCSARSPGVGPELAKRIHDHLNVDTSRAAGGRRPRRPPAGRAGDRPAPRRDAAGHPRRDAVPTEPSRHPAAPLAGRGGGRRAAGRRAAGRRCGIPPPGRGRGPADHRAAPLQSVRGAVAADPPHPSRRLGRSRPSIPTPGGRTTWGG